VAGVGSVLGCLRSVRFAPRVGYYATSGVLS
jgi:hypothetical protein